MLGLDSIIRSLPLPVLDIKMRARLGRAAPALLCLGYVSPFGGLTDLDGVLYLRENNNQREEHQ